MPVCVDARQSDQDEDSNEDGEPNDGLDGRAFFYPGRKMVRITGETSRCLSSHQKLDEIRMTLVKFDSVGCNPSK